MAQVVADELRKNGIALMPSLYAKRLREFLEHLENRTRLKQHVSGLAGNNPYDGTGTSSSWHMSDVILAPHWWECALATEEIAREYLGVDAPLLYSINAFTTYPGREIQRDIQDWHADFDDSKFVVLFLLATETAHDDGAFEMRGPAGERSVFGPAGTMLMADTRHPHRGLPPLSSPRIMAWARWGVSDPPRTYHIDRLEPIDAVKLGKRMPTDPRLREQVRLVAR